MFGYKTTDQRKGAIRRPESLHADLILVMSACPQDLAPVNAGMPTDCEYEVFDAPSENPITASEASGTVSSNEHSQHLVAAG